MRKTMDTTICKRAKKLIYSVRKAYFSLARDFFILTTIKKPAKISFISRKSAIFASLKLKAASKQHTRLWRNW